MTLDLRSSAIGNLVVIGSSTPEWNASILNANAKKIIWLEPDPKIYQSLERLSRDITPFDLISKGVSLSGTTAQYCTINFKNISWMGDNEKLQHAFPGLHDDNQFEIDTMTPSDLVNRLDVCDKPNVLYINVLGLGLHEISELISNVEDKLSFSEVYLRSCSNTGISVAYTYTNLDFFMTSSDYNYIGSTEYEDEFPILHFYENNLAEKLIKAYHKIDILKQELDAALNISQTHARAAAARTQRIIELNEELLEIRAQLTNQEHRDTAKMLPTETRSTIKSTKRSVKAVRKD